MLARKLLAEFLGTYALVFAGTGAIVIDTLSGGAITHVGVALCFGLVVMILIDAFGDLSGAHFNPAVSLGFTFARRFPLRDLVSYISAQIAGALAASISLHLLFPASQTLGATFPAGSAGQSFILELLLTLFLMLVILNVSHGAKEKGITAGIAIGATIGLEALFAGPICGASMNPVRSFAPALISGHPEHLWIYLTAPIAGALAAVPIYSLLRGCPKPEQQV